MGIYGSDFLRCPGLDALPRDNGFAEGGGTILRQHDVKAYRIATGNDLPAARFISNHGEHNRQRIAGIGMESIVAFEIGDRQIGSALYADGGQFDGAAFFVAYIAEYPAPFLRGNADGEEKEQKQQRLEFVSEL